MKEKASRSIAAYVERSSHFFAIVPTIQKEDDDDVTLDYGSWLQSSDSLFELFSLHLSRNKITPPMVSRRLVVVQKSSTARN